MKVQRIDNMFNFTFEKTAEELLTAAKTKVEALRMKIAERGVRIDKMRAEYKVTDAIMIDIQNQIRAAQKRGEERMSYTSNTRASTGTTEEITIGAGVIDFLLAERDHLDGERTQVEQLDLIIRNLREVTGYTANGMPYIVKPRLSYEELKYLGF